MPQIALVKLIAAGMGGLLVGLGLGRFGYPPLIPAMISEGWLSPEGGRFAAATNLAGYGVGALAAVPLMRFFGLRFAFLSALVMGVLAFALSVFPVPSFGFALLRGCSGMAGGLLMIAVPPIIAANVPPALRGRANGFVFTGLGGGFLLSGTLVPLLASYSVASAWVGLTALIAFGAILAALWCPLDTQIGLSAGKTHRIDLKLMGLMLIYGGSAIGYVPHTTFFVDYVARELGLGLSMGGFMWVMAGFTAFLAPILGGYVAEALGFKISLRLIVTLMAIGAGLPALSQNPVILTLSLILGGGLMIGCASFAAGRTRDIVGGEAHASAWGQVTVVFSALQALGAYGFSLLLGASQNYQLVFTVASLIIVCGIVADSLLCLMAEKKTG